jgi:NAD(P)-dependent dehydrogenase (short-subunit alcohol dehydrogenase family)
VGICANKIIPWYDLIGAYWIGYDLSTYPIVGAGGKAVFVQCSVSVEIDVRQAIAAAVATYGKLDGAFNNGVGPVPED